MATKRITHRLRDGDILEVSEYHDGKYGAKGMPRQKKKKRSEEDIQKINALNKARLCRMRLIQYFDTGDCFATWTYEVSQRPQNMAEALKHFQKAIRKVRKEYRKRGYELFWIRNIERGTKGAWHIHLVVNEIGDTASILKKAWPHGMTSCITIKQSDKVYDEDFTKLANYITKNEHTPYEKADGTQGKPRLRETTYSTSRNMPLPEPEVDKLVRWKKKAKPKKGYYIARIYEGINPKTGYKYRRYTQIRLNRRI